MIVVHVLTNVSRCRHLTNYSLNKFSSDFVPVNDDDTGSKRKVGSDNI